MKGQPPQPPLGPLARPIPRCEPHGPARYLSRRSFVATGLTVLATPSLLACLDRSEEVQDGDPRLTARPHTPFEPYTTGASQVGLESGRDGILFIPESYSPDTPLPLFVAMHGAGGSAVDWAPFYERCEARGIILLAIDSRNSTWDRIVYGQFSSDVWYLAAALKHTFDRCAVDPMRVALAGFSDGASYALSLGVSNGDLFTHLVAFSPGFLSAAEPVVGKPLVVVSHGTQDLILPVQGSRDVIVPGLERSGYEVTYHEFEGGHQVPRSISDAAFDWFLA